MSGKQPKTAKTSRELQYATFYLGDQLMGVEIQQVREINRHVQAAPVPHAHDSVAGVINLRGEVVTVLDLRTVFGMMPVVFTDDTRCLIVGAETEKIGLLIDRIAEVVTIRSGEMERPPSNVAGVDARFFTGVYKLEKELMVALNVEQVLCVEAAAANA